MNRIQKVTSFILILTCAFSLGVRFDLYAETAAPLEQVSDHEARRHAGALKDLRWSVERSRKLARKLEHRRINAQETEELEAIKASLAGLERAAEIDLAAKEAELALAGASPALIRKHQDYVQRFRNQFQGYKAGLSRAQPNRWSAQKKTRKLLETAPEKKRIRRLAQKRKTVEYETPFLTQKDLKGGRKKFPLLSYLGKLEGTAYADPLPPELSETLEVAFTQKIDNLLLTLGTPALMYEYVLNNIKYEPYFGSLKGSEGVLLEGAGNDLDQASLLIALLRKSGVPAKYVMGTVEIPIERAKALVGVEGAAQVTRLFQDQGVPVLEVIDSGSGDIKAVKVQHVWVKADLGYAPYRGRASFGETVWMHLDPSFKLSAFNENPKLSGGFRDPNAFLNQVKAQGVVDSANHSVTELPHALITSTLEGWGLAFQQENDLELAELFRTGTIDPEAFEKLPASLPFQTVSIDAEFSDVSELAANLRHEITVKLKYENGDVVFELADPIRLVEAAGNRLSFYFTPDAADPATQEALANASGTTLDVYLINLIPHVSLGGIEQPPLAAPSALTMGTIQTLEIELSAPLEPAPELLTKEIRAGNFYSLVFDLQSASGAMLDEEIAKLDTIWTNGPGSLEEGLGEALHATGLHYFYQMDRLNQVTAGNLDVAVHRAPSLLTASYELDYDEVFPGLPMAAAPDGIYLDILREDFAPVSVNESAADAPKQFMIVSAITSSSLTATGLETLFSTPLEPVTAVSTARLIEAANNREPSGLPIYTFDQASFAQGESNISGLPVEILDDIRDHINAADLQVTVPETQVDSGPYTEAGYFVMDPATGDSGFMLEGGLNGAHAALTSTLLPAPYELIEFRTAAPYQNLIKTPLDTLKTADKATEDFSFSYLPASTSISEWFRDSSSIDEAAAVASILAVTGTIGEAAKSPHFSELTLANEVFSPAACAGNSAKCFSLEAFLSPGAAWTLDIKDGTETLVRSFQGQAPAVSINWDGKNTEGAALSDGVYSFELAADLNGKLANFPETGTVTLDGTAPLVNVTAPLDGASVQALVQTAIRGTAADDLGLDRYELLIEESAYSYFESNSLSVENGTLAVWDASGAVPGTGYQLTLTAYDQAGNTTQLVRSFNLALPDPVIILAPTDGSSVQQNVDTLVQVNSAQVQTLQFLLDTVPAAGPVVLSPNVTAGGNLGTYLKSWSAGLFPPGSYTMQVNGLDGGGAVVGSQLISLNIVAPPSMVQAVVAEAPAPDPFDPADGLNNPLEVSWNLSAPADWRVIYQASASNSLFYDTGVNSGAAASGSWDGTIGGIPAPDGLIDIHLFQILDPAKNPNDPANYYLLASWTNVTVQRQVPPADPTFTIEITHPDEEGAEYESRIDIPFLGGVTHASASSVDVELLYRPQDDLSQWKSASALTVPVGTTLEKLGAITAAFLATDIYEVMAKATDGTDTVYSDIRTYFIDSRLKVGNFVRSFLDYETAINGFPVRISRTYDTQKSGKKGSFGFGWMENNHDVGIQNVGPYDKLLAWHDGSKEYFVWRPQPTSTLNSGPTAIFYAGFVNTNPGGGNRLFIDFNPLSPGSKLQVYQNGGEWFEMDLASTPVERLNPARLSLVTREGFIYTFDGAGKLWSIASPMKGRGGLEVEFRSDGIYKAHDPAAPVIGISRDSQNRIRQVTHGGVVIDYEYDSIGNLQFVKRNYNPALQEGYLKEYVYGPAGSQLEHYLMKVKIQTGWNGTTPVMAEETAMDYMDGMLEGITTSNGHTVSTQHDVQNGVETVTDPMGRTAATYYDTRGNITAVCNTLGECTSFTYDEYGNKITETSPAGLTTTYEYGTKCVAYGPLGAFWEGWTCGEVSAQISDQVATVVSYASVWNGIPKPVRIIEPSGVIRNFEYNPMGQLIRAWSNESAAASETEYDGFGRLTAEGTGASRTDYTYSIAEGEDSLVAEILDAGSGNIHKTIYTDGLPARMITNFDAAAGEQEGVNITYTPDGLLETQTSFANGDPETPTDDPITAGYDENGKMTSFGQGADATTFEWTQDGRPLTVLESGEPVVTRTYYSSTDPNIYARDQIKDVVISDPIDVTREDYTYDAASTTKVITHADDTPADLSDNPTTTIVTDLSGAEISRMSSDGTSAEYVRDDVGRLLEAKEDGIVTQRFVYDEAGRKIAEFDYEHDRQTTWSFDPQTGLLRTEIDTDRGRIDYAYYSNGLLKSVTGPKGTTRYEYDSFGRRTKITHNDGTFVTWTYGPDGKLIAKTDENRNELRYQYHPNGRLLAIYQDPSPFGGGRVDLVRYDANENPTRYTREDALGNKVTYDNDPQDPPGAVRKVTLHRSSGDVSKIFYEPVDLGSPASIPSLPSWALDPAQTYQTSQVVENFGGDKITEYHDENYRLAAKYVEQGDIWTTYAYPDEFTVESRSGHSSSNPPLITKTYDSEADLQSINYDDGKVVNYEYEADTQRVSRVYVNEGGAAIYDVSYSYDPASGRLSGISDLLGGVSYFYDYTGRKIREEFANGIVTEFFYDSRERLNEIVTKKNGSELRKLEYDLSATGLIKEIRVYENGSGLPSRTSTYEYDPLGRIIEESADGTPAFSYTYYLNGSRKSVTDYTAGITRTFTYDDSDRLMSESLSNGITYTYNFDVNGNLIQKLEGAATREQYTFDGENRLLKVELYPAAGPSTIIDYTYTPDGHRLTKLVQGEALTHFITDPTRIYPELIMEYSAASTHAYLHADDGPPVAVTES